MNVYDITIGYINFEYKGNITKMAVIKFGSEEENADVVKYDDNAFIMKVGDFKINPNTIDDDTISGIIFANPKYIETNLAGNVIEQNGNLKIEIKNGGTLDLVIPNKPSIAVVANKQNYDSGINKKILNLVKL